MIPKSVNIQQAASAFGKMTRVVKAFEDTKLVLDVLLNAEQVANEVEARTEQAREDLVKAQKALAGTRETNQTLDAQAKALVAEAKEEAVVMRRAAKAYVTRTQQTADKMLAAAGERLTGLKTTETALQTATEKARLELDEINGKIEAAKKAAREMFAQ